MKPKSVLIGLNGLKGSGKNTVAERLKVYSPYEVVEISYAKKLKESAAALLDCSVEDLELWKNESDITIEIGDDIYFPFTSITIRTFLQRYGTEAHRNVFGDDFWLDAALPLDHFFKDHHLYVVTDMRFPNEMERVLDLGGYAVRVVGTSGECPDLHESETPLECPRILLNDERDDNFKSLDWEVVSLLKEVGLNVL